MYEQLLRNLPNGKCLRCLYLFSNDVKKLESETCNDEVRVTLSLYSRYVGIIITSTQFQMTFTVNVIYAGNVCPHL